MRGQNSYNQIRTMPMKQILLLICTLAGTVLCPAGQQDIVPIYQGYLLPTPQNISYGTADLDLSGFSVSPDSPYGRYLQKRLIGRGGKNGDRVKIRLGIGTVNGLTPPDRPQGYAVRMQDGEVVLAGHDKQGLLWAISSLIQMTRLENGRLLLRTFQGTDWPEFLSRGYAFFGTDNWTENVHLAVTFKLNAVFALSHWAIWPDYTPRPEGFTSVEYCLHHDPPQEWLDEIARMEELAELGIEWGMGFDKSSGSFALSDMAAHRQLMKWIVPVVRAGGTYCILFDDVRFPLKKTDLVRFGTAREADSWYVNFMDDEVKRIRPDARILFCPPFYWGPGSDPSKRYGESREEYLRTIGERLHPDIGIFYTGIDVFAGKAKSAEFAWFAERVKRNPHFYINDKDHPHMRIYHYATDPIGLWRWFAPEIYRDANIVDVYGSAAWMPVPAACGSEYLWNPKAYNDTRAPLDTLAMLIGKNNVELAGRMNQAFSQLDFCGLELSPGAVRKLPEIEAALTEYDQLWKEAVQREAAPAFKSWTIFPWLRTRFQPYATRLKEMRKEDFYRNFNPEEFQRNAKRECGWKSDDLLLTPYDFSGGLPPKQYKYMQKDPRIMTGIRGQGTPFRRIQADFNLKTIGGDKGDLMYICGQDDDMDGACSVSITLNNREIFRGKNPLEKLAWNIWKLPLPKGSLKEGGNTLDITCIDGDGRFDGGRFFLINYIVIK